MKKIVPVFILMALCVIGIIAFQLYYSYVNYNEAGRVFKKDVNEALTEASDSTEAVHNRNVEEQFRGWMNDESYVEISSRWDTLNKVTVFRIKEVNPTVNGQIDISLSVEKISKRIDTITPEAKKLFIDHMVETVHNGFLRGTLWFFTQGIGERLDKAYNQVLIPQKVINEQYRLALKRRGITLPFEFNKKNRSYDYSTTKVNFGIKHEQWMQAGFTGLDNYLLGQLRWVIFGTLLLLLITLACFWYTIKTLLSQQKLNSMKDDFISNMTHEIHTPLSSILVTADALKRYNHDEEERRTYIDIILHQGKRLSGLTEEILNGARMEKTGIVLEDRIAIDELSERLKAGYPSVEVQQNVSSVILKGNAMHLENAVANLLENAFKYNTTAHPLIKLSFEVRDKKIAIIVSDNGPGIPDPEKEKIFGQFYRVPTGNVHNVKGYGLGLSYVTKVVEAHSGKITIEDNKPSGSIFTIILPL